MKIAFWTVTRGAGNTAKEFKNILSETAKDFEITVFTMKKYNVQDTNQIEKFTEELENNFSFYDGHIFIMASGIVIRKIIPLLKGKDVDPAILLMDEGRHFVISLLSGHLGGANELTYKIANNLNLIPVITTSSDITGKIAVDTISQKLNAELEDLKSAKDVTSLIVDGKKVDILLPKNVKFRKDNQDKNKNIDGTIIVSNKKNIEITRIYPKNLILGIGCKRDTKEENILNAIYDILDKHNLSINSIKHFATVDLKADELGLVSAIKKLEKELKIISREEIIKIEDLFEGSDFVKKNIGVRAVSEPVSLLSSYEFMKEYEKYKNNFDLIKKIFEEKYKNNFIEMKAIYNGITISIYEEENIYEQ